MMKVRNQGGRLFGLLLLTNISLAEAASLDGTVNLVYQSSAYNLFVSGDYARGFVRLDAGFSVPAGAIVNFNVLQPVAGAINLNTTGIIVLDGDLTLASNASLSTGGIINGQGNAIFLNGDLTVPTGAVLEFTGNTIIDGQGHELILQNGSPGGQLYINGPAGTSLTLRNVTIRGVKDFNGTAAIRVGSASNQTLILENTKLCLAGAFYFWDGKLEINNDVKIFGFYDPAERPELVPMLFYYYSSDDCIIHADSILYLDMTVGFIYAPVDNRNSHLKFEAASSRLFLNGCSLFALKDTGLLLNKGHLVVDHKTALQSDGMVSGGRAFEFGDKIATHDLAVDILPNASIEIVDANLKYLNQN